MMLIQKRANELKDCLLLICVHHAFMKGKHACDILFL